MRLVLCLPETYPGNYYSVSSSSKVFLLMSCMDLLCQLVIKTDVCAGAGSVSSAGCWEVGNRSTTANSTLLLVLT